MDGPINFTITKDNIVKIVKHQNRLPKGGGRKIRIPNELDT